MEASNTHSVAGIRETIRNGIGSFHEGEVHAAVEALDGLIEQFGVYEQALVEIAQPFSGVDPNLQQIARDAIKKVRGENVKLRDLFVPTEESNPASDPEPCDYCRQKGREWTPSCEDNKRFDKEEAECLVSNDAKRRLTPEAEKQWREMVDPYLEPNEANTSERENATAGPQAQAHSADAGDSVSSVTGRDSRSEVFEGSNETRCVLESSHPAHSWELGPSGSGSCPGLASNEASSPEQDA